MQSTSKVELGQIFGDVKLNIPKYQRSYSWEKKQVREMFEDVIYAMENYRDDNQKYHYFGTIVLEDDDSMKVMMNDWDRYNVIDGQQRLITTTILIRVITDYLDSLTKLADEKKLCSRAEDTSDKLKRNYIQEAGYQKLEPEDLSEDYYNKMVVKSKEPSDVVESDSPLVAHRIKDAIEVFRSLIETELDGLEEPEDGIKHLMRMVQTLSSDFRLTPNIMKDMDEASRMFKIVNERGKNISIMDKIKSHLMYATTETDGSIEPEYVSSKINEAVRSVTKYPGCDEKDVDALAQRHWLIFTGELRSEWAKNYHKYDANYRSNMNKVQRIQNMPWYASIDRNTDGLEDFIRQYVDSLEAISESFANYRFSDYLHSRNKISDSLSNIFVALHQSGSQEKFELYVTSVLYTLAGDDYNKNSKADNMLREALKPSIMYDQIMKNTRGYRRIMTKLAHKIFWYEWSEDDPNDERDSLFDGRKHANWNLPTTKRGVIEEAKSKISQKNDQKNIVDTSEERLVEPDILDGEYTNGWGGVRSTTTIKILLYYHERSIRSSTGGITIPSLNEWCNEMELEHMIPKNPRKGERIPQHNKQVNKLGNYIVLAPKDNQVASNRSYEYKKQNILDDLNLKIAEDVPSEATAEEIDKRSNRIIENVKSYLQE